MSYSIKILDCHGGCAGCYEAEIRKCQGKQKINLPAILSAIDKIPQGADAPTIHGGEPLIITLDILEALLKKIHGRWGHTGVQTSLPALAAGDSFGRYNGHIELFKKYNTHVGVSIDGSDAETNAGRWDGVGNAHDNTIESMRGMVALKNAGINMSAIVLLRNCNAGQAEHAISLPNFLDDLYNGLGITDFRLNAMIAKNEAGKPHELEPSRLFGIWSAVFSWSLNIPGINVQPFRDVIELLMGYTYATCNLNSCDPYSTTGEQTILADGSFGGCLKTGFADNSITGINDGQRKNYRRDMLTSIPFIAGGCGGCQWVDLCGGGCPGEGIDNDWRKRTRFCEAWAGLFGHIHTYLSSIFPNIDLAVKNRSSGRLTPDQVKNSISKSTWRKSERPSAPTVVTPQHGASQFVGGHGDIPHGDSHGDSGRK